MATDNVAIVNSAMIKMGVETISTMADTSKQAVLANEQYAKLRDDLLTRYYWDFAIKRASLTEDASAPAFEYDNRFILPADYLRAFYVYVAGSTNWIIEGDYLLTNEETVKLVYVGQITDTTKYTKTFDELLALRIARDLSYALVQSITLKKDIRDEYSEEIKKVRSIDAMVGTPINPNDDVWLRSRINGPDSGSPYFGSFRSFP